MTSTLQFKAVLFDLDDTLYDRSAAFLRWAQSYVHDRLGIRDSRTQHETLSRIIALDDNGYGSKKAVVEEVCRIYPVQDGNNAGASQFYEEFFATLVLDENANLLLQTLEQKNIPWGIITNGLQRQWRKIDQMGLRERTDCIFVSETFGCKKPDPAIFLAAAERLGMAPLDILFVGDHPANDISGAHRAGMRTAWLHRNKPWPAELAEAADLTINSLDELLPIIL